MADPFRSHRLLYRAAESPEDEPFFLKLQQDPIAYQNSNINLSRPQGKASARKYIKDLDEALIGVVICIAPTSPDEKPDPIGAIKLTSSPARMMHHRFSEIGIDIVKDYQGKGHGSEAIMWILGWAFERAGLHRVMIRAFTFNEGAVRLYRRLGFVEEGRSRELVWFEGRFWDDVQFAVLEGEWKGMKERFEKKMEQGSGK